MAVQVTLYLTEGDSWHHRPLHLEILKYLRDENVAGAVALHSVAGSKEWAEMLSSSAACGKKRGTATRSAFQKPHRRQHGC